MKPEIRNSIPSPLAFMQRWMESEHLLRRILQLDNDAPLNVLRIRRNFKFRKLIIESGEQRFICYTHYWPRGLRNLAAFTERARAAGIPVPQPISQSLDWSGFLGQRCFSLVLPYIPGSAIGNGASEAQIVALGELLGRLHGIRDCQWGPLMTNFRSHGSYWSGLQRYWAKTESQLVKYGDFAERRDITAVMQWLKQHSAFLGDLSQFSLVHGDPASGNFLVQPGGELCLIDCDRIAYEPAPLELANSLLQAYCQDDTPRRIKLVEAYLSVCPPDIRQSWEAHAQFFITAALLWRGQRKLQWSIKRRTAGHSSERARRAWRQIIHSMHARPSDWRAAVALLAD